MIKDLMLSYAISMVGLPYIWGGDSPLEGFDCSGLVIELLKAEGRFPVGDDTTAQGLYLYFKDQGFQSTGAAERGCLAFYGKSVNEITHVAYCLDEKHVIEAAGGNHTTITPEIAKKQNAHVRIRQIRYRKDFLTVINKKNNVRFFNKFR